MPPMPVRSLLLVVVITNCFSSVVSSDYSCNLLSFGQTIGIGDAPHCLAVALSGNGDAYCCYGITRKPYCCSSREAIINFVIWCLAGLVMLYGLCKICGCCGSKKDKNARIIVIQTQREP